MNKKLKKLLARLPFIDSARKIGKPVFSECHDAEAIPERWSRKLKLLPNKELWVCTKCGKPCKIYVGKLDISDMVKKEDLDAKVRSEFEKRWRKFESENFFEGLTTVDRRFFEKVMEFIDDEIMKQPTE